MSAQAIGTSALQRTLRRVAQTGALESRKVRAPGQGRVERVAPRSTVVAALAVVQCPDRSKCIARVDFARTFINCESTMEMELRYNQLGVRMHMALC